MDKHLLLKITAEQLKYIDKRRYELRLPSRSAFIRLLLDAMMSTPVDTPNATSNNNSPNGTG